MEEKKANFKTIAVYIRLGILLLVIGALFVPFAVGLKMTVASASGNVVTTYRSAFSFIFGGQIVSEHVSYKAFGISITGLLGFIFMAASLIALGISILTRKNKQKLSVILLIAAFVTILTSGILMFCSHQTAANVLADAILGEHSDAVTSTIYKNTSLEFGFWGVGLFAIIADLGILVSLFFDGTVDKVRDLVKAKL